MRVALGQAMSLPQPLLCLFAPLLLVLASCGASEPDALQPDGGADALSPDAEPPKALVDLEFPELAETAGFRDVMAHDESIHVVAYQRLRLHDDGRIDETFDWQSSSPNGKHLLDSSGRPLVLFVDQGSDEWGIEAHTLSGEYDDRFVDSARVEFESPSTFAHDIDVTDAHSFADGSLLVVGNLSSRTPAQKSRPWLARVSADGSLDLAFGEGGYAVIEPTDDEPILAEDLELGPDGSIFIVAHGQAYEPIIVALEPNGSVKETFAEQGILKTGLGTRGSKTLVVDAMGRVAIGTGDNESALVARYLPSGALDSEFGNGGLARLESHKGTVGRLALVSGELVGVGTEESLQDNRTFWFKMNSEGALTPGLGGEAIHLRDSIYMNAAIDAVGRVLLLECTELGSFFCDESGMVRLNH